MFAASGADAAKKINKKQYTPRRLLSSINLPKYENPSEVDIERGKLHISFKGVFRGIDNFGNPNDWLYFAFTVRPENDMYLAVGQSEMFDSKAERYKYYSVPQIGSERAFGRELIAGVTVPVLVGVNVPVSTAGEMPSVSRMTVTFNKESLQYRNIIAEEWQTWEELKESLGI